VNLDRVLTHFPQRVVLTWLNEFGYVSPDVVSGLNKALRERSADRLFRELDLHAKRLADRAQMEPQRMQGRAGVIR
jgi:hypothetical protein